MVSLVIRADSAVGIFGQSEAQSIDAAFAAVVAASTGLVYQMDFTQFADSAAMRAYQDKGFHSVGFGETHLLSAAETGLGTAKALRLIQLDRGSKGGSWGDRYDRQGGPLRLTEFWFFGMMRLNRALKEWRWDDCSIFEHQDKLFNFEQSGSGQVVLGRQRLCPGPNIMMNAGGLLARFFSTAPHGQGSFSSILSSGVGNGSSLPANPNLEDIIRTYGWDWNSIQANKFEEDINALDLTFKTSAQTGGDPTQNFLGHASRNWPHGGYGLPDIMHEDFVEFPADDWMPFEVHVKRDADTNLRRVELWAATFLGAAPKLQVAYVLQGGGSRENDLSNNTDFYEEFEALIYNTPTTVLGTDRAAAVGYQPPLILDYSRFLVSNVGPIPFANLNGPPHPLPGSSALAQAIALLSDGGSTTYAAGKLDFTVGSMGYANWNALFHYDENRQEFQALGKDQSPGNLTGHVVFSESADSWRLVREWSDNIGHAYCGHTMDPATGDYYFIEWSDQNAQRYDRAADAWIADTATSGGTWGTAPHALVAWHPNLFGVGDGGLVVLTRQLPVNVYFWRKSTNTWSNSSVSSFITVNTREGAAVYSPALDAVICGGGDSTNDLIRVNSNTSIAEIAAAPAPVGAWTSATTNRSVLTVHPTSGKPMILGREADSGTVWIYESASNTWATQAYTHPFDTGTVDNLWTACRVRLYGAMAALKQKSDKTCDMVLWRKLT